MTHPQCTLTPRQLTNYGKKLARATCHLWTARTNKSGYGTVNINGKMLLAHRVAWEIANGPIPASLWVLHNCPGGDNPACCNPDHLWLGTHADNMADMVAKGRQGSRTHPERLARGDRHGSRTHPERLRRGENHHAQLRPECLARGDRHGTHTHPERLARGSASCKAKVTEDDAREIRRLYAAGGVTQRVLGERFGLTQSSVSLLIHGINWAHLD